MKKLVIFGILLLVFSSNSALATRVVLDNVPHYQWWYGCTPTAAGSLMAYWDSQPGFENLYKPGDAQIYNGDGTWGTRRMVASQRHINGDDNPPDSLASFLGTSIDGWTPNPQINIPLGLRAFAEWDDTSSYDMKDGYQANMSHQGVYQSSFHDIVKSELDAGRPLLLSVDSSTSVHSVLAYGYDDDITFDVFDNGDVKTITVPGFAVMDTWTPGSGDGSQWYNWEGGQQVNVEEIFDGQGNEWWPFFPKDAFFMGNNDWQVGGIYTFELVPEPTTILLFALGGLMLRKRHRA